MAPLHWIIPALFTAFFTASQDAWVKRHFSHLTAYDMLAFPMAYSLPLFGLVFPLIALPELDRVFLVYFLLCIPVNGLGFLLHMRAIQRSPLSLTLPYLAFTPVFILFAGFIILGEVPNRWGGSVFASLWRAATCSISIRPSIHLIYRLLGTGLMIIGAALVTLKGH